jgi:hypothetical protein
MHNTDVYTLSPSNLPEWDALVMKSPNGTIFHSSKWIKACAELLSIKEVLYCYYKDDELIGGCSVYEQKRYRFFSMAISTAPMTPYGGYIFSPFGSSKVRENEQIRTTIISEINNQMIQRFDYIKIVNSPEFFDIRPFSWSGWNSFVNYAYYFDLNEHIEENISKNVRRTIRKAKKFKIIIEKENNADLFYFLFTKTYEKQNLPVPVTKDFLVKMIDMIISNNFGEIWIARTPDGEPAAAEIIIWDNKRAYRWAGALDPQFKDTGATSLLFFEIFQDLQKRGFHEINLMAGNTPHLANFISSFNPRLVPYYGIEKTKKLQNILNLFLRIV